MRPLNFNVEARCTPSRSALMTGRFSIRSGTYESQLARPDGLTLWEITIADLLSAQGYAIGIWVDGISEALKSGSPCIRYSMSGLASRVPTTRLCGHR